MRRGIGRLRAGGGNAVAPPPTTAMEAWFRKGVGITSAANAVSNWANQASSGAARDLAQATGAAQPTLQAAGTILFNGTSHVLKCAAFTLNQPETVYLRVKQVAWVAAKALFAGNVNDTGVLYTHTSSPNIAAFAGTFTTDNGALAVGAWGSVAVVINGASTVVQVDATTVTGSAGAANMAGFTLGANGSGLTDWSNIEVAEAIVYSAAHDATQRAAVIAYLNTL